MKNKFYKATIITAYTTAVAALGLICYMTFTNDYSLFFKDSDIKINRSKNQFQKIYETCFYAIQNEEMKEFYNNRQIKLDSIEKNGRATEKTLYIKSWSLLDSVCKYREQIVELDSIAKTPDADTNAIATTKKQYAQKLDSFMNTSFYCLEKSWAVSDQTSFTLDSIRQHEKYELKEPENLTNKPLNYCTDKINELRAKRNKLNTKKSNYGH